MGFIEALVPAAPALIEKNKTKRIINKCIYPSHRVPFCARTPTFDVEPFFIAGASHSIKKQRLEGISQSLFLLLV